MTTTKPVLEAYHGVNDEILVSHWNTLLQQAKWEQESAAGTGANPIGALAPAYLPQGNESALTNGGFEEYQRGVGPVVSTGGAGQIIADGWACFNGTFARETGQTDGSGASLKIVTNGTDVAAVQQQLFDIERFRGQPMTLTGRYFSADPLVGYVALADGVNAATGDFLSSNGAWTTLTAALPAVSGGAATLFASFYPFGQGTIYLDNFALTPTVGRVAYEPLDIGPALYRAQGRFCTRDFSFRWRNTLVGEIRSFWIPFPAGFMVQTPDIARVSVTAVGTSGVDYNNIGGVVVGAIAQDGVRLDIQAGASAPGATYMFKSYITADAGIF